jgi:hypothetical protein
MSHIPKMEHALGRLQIFMIRPIFAHFILSDIFPKSNPQNVAVRGWSLKEAKLENHLWLSAR